MEDPALVALAQSPAALIAAFLLGTLWGSFANVCIYRWPPTPEHPHGRSVVKPGSHCGACGKPVRWYDNVPMLSWLWLRGRCRDCKTEFSARYVLVEGLTGALFAAAWWFAVDGRALLEPLDVRLIRFAIGAGFAFVMVVVLFIDLDHMLILDRLTLPAMVVLYGVGLLLPERTWPEGLVGAAVGLALVRVIADLFLLIRGRYGLGMGDGKLLAVVGALLGWKGPMVSLFLGATVAVVVTLPVMAVRSLFASDAADGDDAEPEPPLPPPLPWAERRVALWSLAVVGAAIGLALVGVPPWICAVAVIVAALADDFLGLTEPAAAGDAAADADPAADHEADPGLDPRALPFGPFLAVAALFWWFAEPYVMFRLRHP